MSTETSTKDNKRLLNNSRITFTVFFSLNFHCLFEFIFPFQETMTILLQHWKVMIMILTRIVIWLMEHRKAWNCLISIEFVLMTRIFQKFRHIHSYAERYNWNGYLCHAESVFIGRLRDRNYWWSSYRNAADVLYTYFSEPKIHTLSNDDFYAFHVLNS